MANEHRELAIHWLAESEGREPEAGRECVMTAQVHAILAVAHELVEIHAAIREAS